VSETVRVYVNAKPIDVIAAGTALDAIQAFDPAQAAAVRAGEKGITDSRGIPTTLDAPVHNGAIFRIVRARQAADDDDLTLE
jgi:hypothetical protein